MNGSEEILKKFHNFTRELKGIESKTLTFREIELYRTTFNEIVKEIKEGKTKWTFKESEQVYAALNEFVERFSDRGFIYSEDNLNHKGFIGTYLDEFMSAFLSLDISTLGPVAIAEYTTCFEEIGRTIKSLSPSKSSQLLRVQYELYSKDFYQTLSNRRNKRRSSKGLRFVDETLTNSTTNSKKELQLKQIATNGNINPSVPTYPNAKVEFSIFDTFLQFFYENNKTLLQNKRQNSANYFGRSREKVDIAEEATILSDYKTVLNEETINSKNNDHTGNSNDKTSHSCFTRKELCGHEAEIDETKRRPNEDKMRSGNDAIEDDENDNSLEINQASLKKSEPITSSGSNQEEAEHIAPEGLLEEFMTTFTSLDITTVDDDALEEYMNRFEKIGQTIKNLHPSESAAWLKTKYDLYRRHFWLIIAKKN